MLNNIEIDSIYTLVVYRLIGCLLVTLCDVLTLL